MYYDTYYNLTADPFRLSPDHRFSFDHPSYAKARAYLEYALYRGDGFIVITGAPGTGKTTLIADILSGIKSTSLINVALLNSTQLEERDLLHMVAAAFGLPCRDINKASLLLEIQQFLTQQGHRGRRAVLIVDEAQGLSRGAMEELRQLANLQLKDRLLLQVFLVGQEGLRDLVEAEGMEQLNQRVVAASHLEPLSLEATVTYIEHRLKRAGWRGDPKLSGAALRLVHRFSAGVPRRINLICSRLFLHGGMEEKHELVAEDVHTVIAGLQREHLLGQNAAESPEAEAPEAEDGADADLALPRKNDPDLEAPPQPRPQATKEDVSVSDEPPEHRGSEADEGAAAQTPTPEEPGDALGPVVDALEEKRDSVTVPPSSGRQKSVPARVAAVSDPDATQLAPVRVRRGAKPAPGKAPKQHRPRKVRKAPRAASTRPQQAASPVSETSSRAGRWAVITLIVLLGGLTFGITSGLIDFEQPGPMQALTKRVDDAVALVSGQQGREETKKGAESPVGSPARDDAAGGLADGVAKSPSPDGDAQRLQAEAEDSLAGDPGEGVPTGAMEVPATAASADAVEQDAAPSAKSDAPATGIRESETTGRILRESESGESEAPPEAGAAGSLQADEKSEKASQDVARSVDATSSKPAPQARAPKPDEAPATPPAQAAKTQPSAGDAGSRSRATVETEKERLSREAEERFAERVARLEPESETTGLSTPASAPPAAPARAGVETAKTKSPSPGTVEPSAPKVSPPARPTRTAVPSIAVRTEQATSGDTSVKASSPKFSNDTGRMAAAPSSRAPEVPSVASAVPASRPKIDRRAQLRSTLLEGQWSSRGKPASLLPSDVTLCKGEGSVISCWSVPRNIDTKYGEAVYKIEARLQDFSSDDSFRVSYRTLVRLVDKGGGATPDDSDPANWQVSENAMRCRLVHPDMVSCRDEQGVVREYDR